MNKKCVVTMLILLTCLIVLAGPIHAQASVEEIKQRVNGLKSDQAYLEEEINNIFKPYTEVLATGKYLLCDAALVGFLAVPAPVPREECSKELTAMVARNEISAAQATAKLRYFEQVTKIFLEECTKQQKEREERVEKIKELIAIDMRWLEMHGEDANIPTRPDYGAKYEKGALIAEKILPGNKSEPSEVGIVLEKGKAYIVAGEDSVSLWDGQNDGCDSVFRYKTPLEANGGPLVVWGQLRLLNPNVHLSDLLEKQLGRKLNTNDYNPAHLYEAVVIGEGLPLKAIVHDGGSYGDNHGQLLIKVYAAIHKQ